MDHHIEVIENNPIPFLHSFYLSWHHPFFFQLIFNSSCNSLDMAIDTPFSSPPSNGEWSRSGSRS